MTLVVHWNNGDWYVFSNMSFSMKASTKTLVIACDHYVRSIKLKEMPKLQAGTSILEVYAESNTWVEEKE